MSLKDPGPSHGMNSPSHVFIPKRISRIGMIRANEKMLNIAENMVRITDQIRFFL
jgi:hypothetical protein